MKWIINHKKQLLLLLFTLFFSYFVITLTIILFGLKDRPFKADLIVVLGTTVYSTGKPSPGLTARLNKTIEIYQQGYAPRIMVSGGLGKEGYDESLVMANFLIKRGIPKHAIIKDNLGNNTRASAYNAYQYMRQHQLQSVIIISQYYHIARAKLAFKEAGIKSIGHASTSYVSFRDFYSVARELLGYPVYLLNIK